MDPNHRTRSIRRHLHSDQLRILRHRPARPAPIVTTPADYGLEYEDVEFQSTDGLALKGGVIPAEPGGSNESDKVVILTHPFPLNRHGFLVKNQGPLPLSKTQSSPGRFRSDPYPAGRDRRAD